MKVGTFCYATEQGLGILARDFYDHGVITHPLIVCHGKHETLYEWYPTDTPCVASLGSREALGLMQDHCRLCDVMLFFETPFVWDMVDYCRQVGTKVVLMPMHECLHEKQYQRHQGSIDLLLCPSLLDLRIEHLKKVFLPVPVEVPWRQRTRAEVFVHNAGHGGLRGRNGTQEFIHAAKHYVTSPAKFLIRCQATTNSGRQMYGLDNLDSARFTMQGGGTSRDELFLYGDVFVFPEKFNGLSLPLQEARAAGMLVMGADRFPMNAWLPRDPLIHVADYRKTRVGPPYREFDEAVISPPEIGRTIDLWYGRDLTDYSLAGRGWAERHSWAVLGPQYQTLLGDLL